MVITVDNVSYLVQSRVLGTDKTHQELADDRQLAAPAASSSTARLLILIPTVH